jgi:Galactose oxidase-like, Early set domain
MLSAGGTLDYPGGGHGFAGRKDAALFDPVAAQWRAVGSMAGGRWYPTLITLGDGRVLAASGLSEHGGLNSGIEIYDSTADSWQALPVPPHATFPGLPLYAHLFLLEDGRLLFAGGRTDDPSEVGPCVLDVTTNPVHVTAVAGLRSQAARNQAASVLLPPAQDQKVMILGGGPLDQTDAIDQVEVIDLKSSHPVFHPAAPMGLPRMHSNAVLLPDRTVFVSGGSLQRESEVRARLQAEIYDPATNQWRIAATATVSRKYHSVALLLPDGRVVAAGGNPQGGHQVAWEPPDPNEELRLEVYSPPYLFRGPRPSITSAPGDWSYGMEVNVGTDRPADIKWASLISPSVTTHSFNNTQRLVDLPILSRQANRIKVEVTANANLAPPGWYMLFLTDDTDVPSVTRWIKLS